MSYKIALVYSSKTGNTKELVDILKEMFHAYGSEIFVARIDEFELETLNQFDAIVIGLYTWGDGEIPTEMLPLYRAFENQDVQNVVTGVVGTGDQFYPKFCGSVDEFRDMLYVHTQLAVTLKVELLPQMQDLERCRKFVETLIGSLRLESRNQKLEH